MSNEEDRTLVEACLSGDRTAFAELVTRYEAGVYRVVMRLTGNREDALDATQSAFLKAYDRLDTYKPEHKFFSWICRIGVNEALNHLKKQQRMTPLEFEAPTAAADPEEALSRRQTSRRIQAALDGLTPDYRVVIVLRHFHDLSYQEMSDVLAVPAKTIKSRLFTARRALRDLLVEQGMIR
jgi:RNA polymerase sigma-70 factor (ECF subfamily)